MWFLELGGGAPVRIARWNPNGPPTRVLQPFSSASPSIIYAYMVAFSDNDIWVVARLQTAIPPYIITHWNGSSWHQVSLTGSNASYFYLTGMSGLSTNDVWLSGVTLGSGGGHMAIAHWNGTTFSIVGVSPYGNSAGPILEISPTDVWATATYNDSKVILAQWNGSRFSFNVLPAPPGQSNAGTIVEQIAATGPNNIWVVGQHSNGNAIDGRIWRYNGNWQPYLYSPATGSFAIFVGVAPLDATRTVITAEGQFLNQGIITYGYSGTTRFHSIPNTFSLGTPSGPDTVVPGTSNFWLPFGTGLFLASCK